MKYQEATRIKTNVHAAVLALLGISWVAICDVAAPHEPLPVEDGSAYAAGEQAVSMPGGTAVPINPRGGGKVGSSNESENPGQHFVDRYSTLE